MEVDTSELRALSVDLGSAASKVLPDVRATVKKAAQVLKEDYSGQAAGSSLRGIAHTITYDIANGGLEAEIGPDRSRGGGAGLAGFFLGWPNGGGGGGDLDGPLAREGATMMRFLDDALGKAL